MRERVLFHSHHGLGMGHLVRALALAHALDRRFDVTLVVGGAMPRDMPVDASIALHTLPPLHMIEGGAIATNDGRALGDVLDERRKTLLALFDTVRPDAVLIDLFPFGRKKLMLELLALLEHAHAARPRPVVVSSLRDVLVTARHDQQTHDDRACALANRWFDAVLVHGDPRLAQLANSFRPSTPLAIPVRYTGYVTRRDPPAQATARHGVVVSAGGGRVGHDLLAAALEAHELLYQRTGESMHIVAGPFTPDDTWCWLTRAVTPGLTLTRAVPDLRPLLADAAVSVSQAGYNTIQDVLQTNVRPLLVPYEAPRENEQIVRAARLVELGVARMVSAAALDGPGLANAIETTLAWTPAPLEVDVDGGARTADAIADLLAARRAHGTGGRDGFALVRAALDTLVSKPTVFFRDDDVGWEDARLFALLDTFARRAAPLDLAVIPDAIAPPTAREIANLRLRTPDRIGLHQHGRAHANHEPTGRRCEFGDHRDTVAMRTDLVAGRERLRDLVGPLVDPIFTPPWNRMTRRAAVAAQELGFRAVSRDDGAERFDVPELAEIPVHVDWVRCRREHRLDAAVAEALASERTVGMMLHHAAMDADDLALLDELLRILASAPGVRVATMRACLETVESAQ